MMQQVGRRALTAVGLDWTTAPAERFTDHIHANSVDAVGVQPRVPRWIHLDQLQQHTLRTAAYASGHLNHDAFEPGLEPVWCHGLHHLVPVALPSAVLDRIEDVL
ncbi:hypothetical protein ACWDYK_18940 [Streptomyces anthocyanicus]|nr:MULTISPECIES: hypothetical protein [Streptomyces]